MTEELYDIGGMHCAACASAVERVTKKLPGVTQSEVNLPMNRLRIVYDEGQCSPQDIITKVEKAGFAATGHKAPDKSTPAEDTGASALRQERAALVLSCVFAGAVLFFSMGHMLFPGMPLPERLSPETHPVNFALLQALLTVPVLLLGRRFFTSGFRALLHGNPNMDTLVALSATASFLYSLVVTFLLTDKPSLVHSLYYESAAVVVALVSVGKFMEEKSKKKTKDAITRLLELAPDTAVLVDENGQWEVPTTMLKVGDTVLIKPGARVPLDGVVLSGSGSINEAMLTGESLPVEKGEGSEVIGGSVSTDGALFVRVTRTGEDTTLAGIIRFVEEAQGKKAPIAKAADRVAGIFVPAVLAVAVLSAGIWLLTGADLPFAVRIFTSVLVIACPCAMGLATPTAILVGTGLGARHGILIRSGEALERTQKTDVVIFDKTGTLTRGQLTVTDMETPDEEHLLQTLLALESLSEHPIAKAICTAAREHQLQPATAEDFANIAGRGVRGSIGGKQVLAGNCALLAENGIDTAAYADSLARLQAEGKTVLFAAENKEVLGLVAVADTVRPEAKETMEALHALHIQTVLLTGDNRAAAEHIGNRLCMDAIEAEVLPTGKAEIVKAYQKNGKTVLMVGDGINDAPALAQADIGCAVGGGSNIAMDTADIVLLRADLSGVHGAIRLSRLTLRNIRQNLFWAFCYNVLGIPIAAGVLYPAFGLLLSPMLGGLAMSLSSLFVVTNALRLKGKKL